MFLKSYRKEDPSVPTEILLFQERNEKMLEAGRLAPSARNVEPWQFIAVSDEGKRQSLSKGLYAKLLCSHHWSLLLVETKKASPDWYAIDVALAVENMILTAVSEGLGTCCVGSFYEKDVKEVLKIPDNYEVLVMLAVGYAHDKIDLSSKLLHLMHSRKTIREVVSKETFGKPYVPKKVQEP